MRCARARRRSGSGGLKQPLHRRAVRRRERDADRGDRDVRAERRDARARPRACPRIRSCSSTSLAQDADVDPDVLAAELLRAPQIKAVTGHARRRLDGRAGPDRYSRSRLDRRGAGRRCRAARSRYDFFATIGVELARRPVVRARPRSRRAAAARTRRELRPDASASSSTARRFVCSAGRTPSERSGTSSIDAPTRGPASATTSWTLRDHRRRRPPPLTLITTGEAARLRARSVRHAADRAARAPTTFRADSRTSSALASGSSGSPAAQRSACSSTTRSTRHCAG